MADVALESGVAFEFIKYLKAQLKETREQLQRANEVSPPSTSAPGTTYCLPTDDLTICRRIAF